MHRLRRPRLVLFALAASLGLSACQSSQKSNVSVDFYSISGNSTAALDREIKRKGPKLNGGQHAVAVARIKMLPSIAYLPVANGCRISSAKVPVNAKVTLPRWTGRKRASKKLGEAWDNIDRYTRLHEATHVAIAFRFARKMEQDLLKLQTKKNCGLLKKEAKRIVDLHLKEHDSTQKEFDADEQRRLSEFSKVIDNRKSG